MFIPAKLGFPIGTPEVLSEAEILRAKVGVILKRGKDFYLYRGRMTLPNHGLVHTDFLTKLRHYPRAHFFSTTMLIGGDEKTRIDLCNVDPVSFSSSRFMRPTITESLEFKPTISDYGYRAALNNNAVLYKDDGTVISFFAGYPRDNLPPPYIVDLECVCKAKRLKPHLAGVVFETI